MKACRVGTLGGLVLLAAVLASQAQDIRAQWNAPQAGFRVFGNTYYVGPRGLASILVTSDAGHVLIDGALPESAPLVADNVRRLGFRVEDIKLILNSHVHYDHAGGIGELQRLSRAKVAASAASARVFERGQSGPDDPQYGGLPPIARLEGVEVVADGQTVRVGTLEITAHMTGGHTPGGTSWTWTSCENGRCRQMVYADSVTAVSSRDFRFTSSKGYPAALADFERSFAFLEQVSCDLLLTPRPEASDLWGRLAKRESGDPDGFVDTTACRRYAERGRAGLRTRLESERSQ
jgi:metallo-beta-lactamase class B